MRRAPDVEPAGFHRRCRLSPRRARAVLRLHRRTLVPLAIVAVIAFMALHWT
ncbi:hypothetical protein [Anaeromyxobacter oryzisoli]|uniref:hypothetical protein n=1 Tax=Anaeromyxobacter oryzisoli TaxID=2925408 RepID=UPI001F59FD83|nr:hypothetical protein [Anaeromyxobacter sp. SG63]